MNKSEQEEEISLGVLEGFHDLILLKVLVLHSSLIVSQTLHSNAALPWAKHRGRDWRVGKEQEQDDAPYRTKSPDDDEFVLPGCEGSFDMPNSITK